VITAERHDLAVLTGLKDWLTAPVILPSFLGFPAIAPTLIQVTK